MQTNLQMTSLFAYHTEVKPSLGTRQEHVYNELARHSDATNTELSRFLGLPINTITPRIKELRDKGMVCEATKRLCNITGRTCIAWRAVQQMIL